jgi:hypothetical protein
VDASPVEVEAERFSSAVADGEGGDGLSRVGEPVQFAQPEVPWLAWMSRSTPPAPIAASC